MASPVGQRKKDLAASYDRWGPPGPIVVFMGGKNDPDLEKETAEKEDKGPVSFR